MGAPAGRAAPGGVMLRKPSPPGRRIRSGARAPTRVAPSERQPRTVSFPPVERSRAEAEAESPCPGRISLSPTPSPPPGSPGTGQRPARHGDVSCCRRRCANLRADLRRAAGRGRPEPRPGAAGMSTSADALRGVCYALAACYGVVVAWCTWQLVQLQRAAPTWSQQKLSHVLALAIGGSASAATAGAWARCRVAHVGAPRSLSPLWRRAPALTSGAASRRLTCAPSRPTAAARVAFFAVAPDWSAAYFYGKMTGVSR